MYFENFAADVASRCVDSHVGCVDVCVCPLGTVISSHKAMHVVHLGLTADETRRLSSAIISRAVNSSLLNSVLTLKRLIYATIAVMRPGVRQRERERERERGTDRET